MDIFHILLTLFNAVWLTTMVTANNSSSFIAFEEELFCLEHLPLNELLRMQRNVQMISNISEIERRTIDGEPYSMKIDKDGEEGENEAAVSSEESDNVVSARFGRIKDFFVGDSKNGANSPMLTPSPYVLNK